MHVALIKMELVELHVQGLILPIPFRSLPWRDR